jgi:shikimate kinase
MILFLIGFMGSGKTTVGKFLAKELDYVFVDMDARILKEEGATINQIFESKGENYFRSAEHNLLKKLVNQDDLVVACGGGTPCFFGNIDLMNKAGVTVYLKLSSDKLHARLVEDKQRRPLLKNKTDAELKIFIKELLEKRERFYNKAQVKMKLSNASPDELAKEIKAELK